MMEDMATTTVLIVDDHAAFRDLVGQVLEAGGFAVVGVAVDGESALAGVDEHRPHVVLLDVQLPDISGFEVARRIASRGGFQPVVVLTSTRDAAEYGSLIRNSVACGFICKSDLSGDALRQLLDGCQRCTV
jgi:DNA-binding NarL/FixJ family response regulator